MGRRRVSGCSHTTQNVSKFRRRVTVLRRHIVRTNSEIYIRHIPIHSCSIIMDVSLATRYILHRQPSMPSDRKEVQSKAHSRFEQTDQIHQRYKTPVFDILKVGFG